MKLWKVFCMEDEYPGLWRQWYKNQCVAVGWNPYDGYCLRESPNNKSPKRKSPKFYHAWQVARGRLRKIAVGDQIVVQLKHHRVGRIGEVIDKAIEDDEWNPLVPASRTQPKGTMGRRILVRWDLTVGPDDKDDVVQLPENVRFGRSEYRPTICEVKSIRIENLKKAMKDPNNWVGMGRLFGYEKSLSDYIAAYPHQLEDGLEPYSSKTVREKVFPDKTRSDVLLLDRKKKPVIVECKQGSPTVKNVKQLQDYMRRLRKETGKQEVRGFLVHGGTRQVPREVIRLLKHVRDIKVVQYRLHVDFTPCT